MSEPIIEYREELNVTDIVRKYSERVARVIDEQTLANVENQLAEYGYVKVVRCRDCTCFTTDELGDYCTLLDFEDVKSMANGFCAWGERRKS